MKKEYIVLGIVIALLAAYLLLHDANRSRYELPAVPAIEGKALTKIEIKKTDGTVTLNRQADDWTIGDQAWPADAEKVKSIVAAIADLRLTALVSTAKAYERYDLTDEKKITVTAWAGDKPSRTFDIGKAADTYQHTFVMLPGDPNVYHAMKNFRKTFEERADGLRTQKVFSVKAVEVSEIKLEKEGKTVVFNRKDVPVEKETKAADGNAAADDPKAVADDPKKDADPSPPESEIVWQTEAGENADKEALERLFSKVSDLRCEAYINDKKTQDFEKPTHTLTLRTEKKSYTLSVFEKTEQGYPGVSSENAYPFLFRQYDIEGLKKEIGTLLEGKKAS